MGDVFCRPLLVRLSQPRSATIAFPGRIPTATIVKKMRRQQSTAQDPIALNGAAPSNLRHWRDRELRMRRPRPPRRDYTSVCTAISNASSTSIPGPRTLLASFVRAAAGALPESLRGRAIAQSLVME